MPGSPAGLQHDRTMCLCSVHCTQSKKQHVWREAKGKRDRKVLSPTNRINGCLTRQARNQLTKASVNKRTQNTFGDRKQRREETTKAESQRKNDKLKVKGHAHNTSHSDNRAAQAQSPSRRPRCAGGHATLVTSKRTQTRPNSGKLRILG